MHNRKRSRNYEPSAQSASYKFVAIISLIILVVVVIVSLTNKTDIKMMAKKSIDSIGKTVGDTVVAAKRINKVHSFYRENCPGCVGLKGYIEYGYPCDNCKNGIHNKAVCRMRVEAGSNEVCKQYDEDRESQEKLNGEIERNRQRRIDLLNGK